MRITDGGVEEKSCAKKDRRAGMGQAEALRGKETPKSFKETKGASSSGIKPQTASGGEIRIG